LAAFARAYGYVRFFYPGETAASTDWNAVALRGVREVESASSPTDLAKRLETVLRPLAPEFQAWPTTGKAPKAEPILSGPGQRWRHQGMGVGKSGIYTSTRVPAEAGVAADLFGASLPGGVSVRLPLVTPTTGAITEQHPDNLAGPPSTEIDRTTRLADVVIAWNVFQHFYPNFDVVSVDWSSQLRPALMGAAAASDAVAFRAVLSRLIAALADGHGVIAYRASSEVLPVSWEWIEDRLVVLAAAPGTGLSVGDVVTAIDGREVAGLLAKEETLISGATPQWKRWRSSQALKAGPVGARAVLTGQRSDGAALNITVQRVPVAEARAVRPARPEPLAELAPGILYIDLDRVGDADLNDVWPLLAKVKGMIFDMRGYPAGMTQDFLAHFSDQTIYSASWNTPVALRPDRQAVTWSTSQWVIRPLAPRVAGKAVFLTDGRAISRAEAFLGVVEGAKLAPIVGETTAGTNGNANTLRLPGDYTVTWTGMRVVKQDGTPHHGVGIKPTVEVHRTIAGVRAGRDEQLETALAIAQGTAPPL
ncbi:MAG TPA: S41 family peptidase, partial [Caulobacter sp.]|nr:S41 family peptidase [Caulobacter sp.]